MCMARPVRIDIHDGVYHVISRGTERCAIFKCDEDRNHFLDRLAETQRRYRLKLYAYVLMDNHFHLIVCTPDANLSRAMQWLKLSYSMWFNAKYDRVGPLFQGRFKGILIDSDESWLLELSLYVHLNPVRVQRLGLGKKEKKTEALGWTVPSRETVIERLEVLRTYRWSSYPYYAGYKRKFPEWIFPETIQSMIQSPSDYRKMTEYRITHGMDEGFMMRLTDRLALGGERFVESVRRLCADDAEYENRRALRKKKEWSEIVQWVEQVRGCSWEAFSRQRGDWARSAVLYLARKYGGMTLTEIGIKAGGLNLAAVSKAIKRFELRLQTERWIKDKLDAIDELSNVQI